MWRIMFDGIVESPEKAIPAEVHPRQRNNIVR